MNSKDKLQKAIEYAMENRPQVGGFPFLAECLYKAGATHNIWWLPSLMNMYIMSEGEDIINQGAPLFTDIREVPKFDQESIIKALRIDQAGESTFPEFLNSIWDAGVYMYDVDFENRTVTYKGVRDEIYTESYPKVEVSELVI